MLKGFFNVPKAVNEPVKGYAPNSPEKAAVLAAAARILVRTACSGGPYHFRKGAVVPAFLRQNSPDGPDGPHRGDKIKKC